MSEKPKSAGRADFTQSSIHKVDQRLKSSQRVAAVCDNPRDPDRNTHWLVDPVRQREYAKMVNPPVTGVCPRGLRKHRRITEQPRRGEELASL